MDQSEGEDLLCVEHHPQLVPRVGLRVEGDVGSSEHFLEVTGAKVLAWVGGGVPRSLLGLRGSIMCMEIE